jgi:four helix bundle protein
LEGINLQTLKYQIILDRQELEKRTKCFHINIIKLCGLLPRNVASFEIAKQLITSAGSVGANYRATKRAKSTADFIYKIQIVLEEADESHYWLTVLKEATIIDVPLLTELVSEANELTAIFAATDKTAKAKLNK